jgi:hypothetical protein
LEQLGLFVVRLLVGLLTMAVDSCSSKPPTPPKPPVSLSVQAPPALTNPSRVDACRAEATRDTAAQVEDLPPGATRAPELERYMRAKLCLQKAAAADEAELLKSYHPEIDDQLARAAKAAHR